MANLEITGYMAKFTREMYNDLKENGYINDESVIIQMSHEIGKELSDILSQNEKFMAVQKNVEILHNNPDFMEFSEQTMKKIILGEIDNGNNS